MTKNTLAVLFGLTATTMLSSSYALEPIQMHTLDNTPPPQQQFIRADAPNPLAEQPSDADSQSAQPVSATVAPVTQPAAAPTASNNAAMLLPATDNSNQPAIHTAPSVALDNNQLQATSLQQKISQLQDDNANFQAMTSAQLSALQRENSQLNNALATISQSLTDIKQTGLSAAKPGAGGFTEQFMQNPLPWSLAGGSLLLTLICLLLLLRPKKSAESVANDDTASEFNYMNSDEAWPAKLDLARAYIAMEDFGQAKKILGQLLKAKCDPELKTQASELIKEMATA